MIWAYVEGIKEKAATGLTGFCPDCNDSLIARCGEINIHHWAHSLGNDCDTWSEGETPWHLHWKSYFPDDWQEVSMGEHRADVKTPNMVVEFQHSPISPEEIAKREAFYGKMVWVVDGNSFLPNFVSWDTYRGNGRPHDTHQLSREVKWKWMRKSWGAATKSVFIDFSEWFDPKVSMFYVKGIWPISGKALGQWVSSDVLFNSVMHPAHQRKMPPTPPPLERRQGEHLYRRYNV